MCVCVYIYIYIYIYKRERKRVQNIHFLNTNISTCTLLTASHSSVPPTNPPYYFSPSGVITDILPAKRK